MIVVVDAEEVVEAAEVVESDRLFLAASNISACEAAAAESTASSGTVADVLWLSGMRTRNLSIVTWTRGDAIFVRTWTGLRWTGRVDIVDDG